MGGFIVKFYASFSLILFGFRAQSCNIWHYIWNLPKKERKTEEKNLNFIYEGDFVFGLNRLISWDFSWEICRYFPEKNEIPGFPYQMKFKTVLSN